jgi:hypothetical protein
MTTITGAEFMANVPQEAGDCVGMLTYQGRIFIACQLVVYEFFPSPTHAAKGRLLAVELDTLKDPPGLIIMRRALQLLYSIRDEPAKRHGMEADIAKHALEEAGYPLSES